METAAPEALTLMVQEPLHGQVETELLPPMTDQGVVAEGQVLQVAVAMGRYQLVVAEVRVIHTAMEEMAQLIQIKVVLAIPPVAEAVAGSTLGGWDWALVKEETGQKALSLSLTPA